MEVLILFHTLSLKKYTCHLDKRESFKSLLLHTQYQGNLVVLKKKRKHTQVRYNLGCKSHFTLAHKFTHLACFSAKFMCHLAILALIRHCI